MAKKQKHPEHVNLERYLISYADFITLLFATFVVLYALSQVDIKDFKALEDSLKQAFDAPSIMQGSEGMMQSSDALFDSSQADSMIAPLMMEYVSQKYEEESLQDIQKNIEEKVKLGELDGVEALKTDKGLLIRFSGDFLFEEGSAVLSASAKSKLDKVGTIVIKKFFLHNMRIEGHTDSQPLINKVYPSNWELSAARASSVVRYFIDRFKFMPNLFTVVGFADTRPISDNTTATTQSKNRRVEIIILKNKYRSQESAVNSIVKMSKTLQEEVQAQRINTISRIEAISSAAKKLSNGDKKAEDDTIILNQIYRKESNRLSKEAQVYDSQTKERITGQGASWLKRPSADKIHVFKK